MPQDKTLWKNNTKAIDSEGVGFTIAVSVYNRDNHETSVPLLEGETIWLTRDERILTANAPREEQDNPFTNGHLLQVEEESRSSGGRSIGDGEPVAPKRPEAPAKDEGEQPPSTPTPVTGPRGIGAQEEAPLVPPADPENSELPPELRLGGDDDASKGEAPAEEPGPVQVVDGGTVEEHASAGDGGPADEETGAAPQPVGEPPVGEFAQHEEVATPEAVAGQETGAQSVGDRPAASSDPIDKEMGLHSIRPPEESPAQGEGGRFRVK